MTEDYILAPQEKYGRKNKPSGKVASKLCTKCSNALPLTEFYKNPQWGGQSFHDAWCRNCVKGHCKDRETLREYCWYNNRLWRDDMYEKSIKQAEYTLSSNADYLKATPEKKRKMLDEQACSHFLGKMNLATVYSYCDNISEENIYREFKPNSLAGTPDGQGISVGDEEDNAVVYSAKWNGNFTKREIAFLDDYYAHIEEGFALDNINLESYSQMVAKAKLHADNSYNKFRRGEISSKEYKEALDMFDTLSKSANFAACKRKPGDTPGLGSFGELVYKIEITGALQENYVEWPKDEVDRLIEEQRHIATALGIEGVV